MAQNNKTVHVVELRGELGSLEQSLSTLKQRLSGLELPKGIDDSFGKLDKVIQALQHRVADGLISPEEFKNVEKEVQQVIKQFGTLAGSLTSLQNLTKSQKLALLPEDAQARLKGVTDALSSYGGTLSAIIKLENERAAAQDKVGTAKARVEAAQTNDQAAREEVARIQAQIEKYGELAEAIKEQEAAERAYAEAQKELEKARRSGVGEKAIKNREEKLSKASREMEGARLVVSLTKEGMEPEQIREYEKAVEDLSAATKKQKVASTELEDALKAQTAAQGALSTVQTQLEQATADGTENAKKQKEAYDSLVAAIKKIRPGFEDTAKKGETIADKMERLRQVVDSLSDDELKKLEPALIRAGEGAKEAQKGVDSLGASLDKAKEETKQFGEEAEKLKALKDKIKQFLGVAGAVEVFRRAARDAISTITELDKTMTEMAVVTDLTVGDYWNQLPEYSKQASELGVSINSAYKAATLYYQQGLKDNEVTKISAETLKMAKIAGLDTADATDKMTAALRGFNMELNETSAQKIADVYSELAAITAADVDEISSAMTKTASIASSAGMEFETTAAFLSQIIETTRESAETAGTAMKTVIARFQELKKAPEDIGEVDGEIVDANAIETALRSVGVSLRDASGQFRELDDVFLELSSKWDGLDKNTQRYIATIAAGSRQQSRFIAMMSNYGRTQELVTAANNSAGASQRQFQKTTESLESKVEKLKNSWHEFTMGIMNSEFVKFGVDVLNTFMEIVNKATSSLDGMWGSLSKIASVLAIFQMGKKIFQKLMPTIDNIMLKAVKKFYGYGEEAGKQFGKGLSGSGSNGEAKAGEKKKREDMTPEEREEDDRQKRLEVTRSRLLANPKNGVGIRRAVSEVFVQPAARIKQAGADAIEATRQQSARRQKAKQLRGEIGGLQRQKSVAFFSSPTGSSVATELDQQIREKEQELQALEAEIQQASVAQKFKATIKTGASSVFGAIGDGTKKLFGVEQFATAKQSRAAALEASQAFSAQQQSEFGKQYQTYSGLRDDHARYEELRGQNQEQLKKRRQEIAAIKAKEGTGRSKEEMERLKVLEEEEKAYQELAEREKQYQEMRKKYGKEIEEYEAAETAFNEKTLQYQKDHEAAWQTVGDNIGKAGEKVIGFGVAMSTLGGIFSQLGLEGVGETFSTIGQYATLAGTAMTALGPIIAMIGKIGVTEAGKLTIAGYTTQLAWWWIALIVTAVVALAVGVALLLNNIKKNSPEAKLEQASEAADKAAEAADKAAQRFEDMNTALDELDDKYKALENLTEGTDEWNKALHEANNSVLDLIEKYPELAKHVQNVNGVLTLDTDSAEVQAELEKAERGAQMAKMQEMSARIGVAQAQKAVDFSELEAVQKIANHRGWSAAGEGATVGGATGLAVGAGGGPLAGAITAATGAAIGAAVGGINASSATKNDSELREDIGSLAKAVLEGKVQTDRDSLYTYLNETLGVAAEEASILADEFANNTDALRQYGMGMDQLDAQARAAGMALANIVHENASHGGQTASEEAASRNMVDEYVMTELKENEMAELQKQAAEFDGKWDNMDAGLKDEWLAIMQEQYGDSVRFGENGKMQYRGEDGKMVDIEYSKEEMMSMIATARAEKRGVAAANNTDDVLSMLGEKGLGSLTKDDWIEIFEGGQNGEAIDGATLEKFGTLFDNTTGKLAEDWKKTLGEDAIAELEKTFGSIEQFEKQVTDAYKGAKKSFAEAKKYFNETFTEQKIAEYGNINALDSSNYAKLADQMETILTRGGTKEEAEGALSKINNLLEDRDADEQKNIASLFGEVDLSNKEAILSLAPALEGYGIDGTEIIKYLIDIADSITSVAILTQIQNEVLKKQTEMQALREKFDMQKWNYDRILAQKTMPSNEETPINDLLSELTTYSQKYLLSASDALRLQRQQIQFEAQELENIGGQNFHSLLGEMDSTGKFDISALKAATSQGGLYADNNALKESVAKIETLNTSIEASIKTLRENAELMEALEDDVNNAEEELKQLVEDYLTNQLEEVVEGQKELSDAMLTASETIASSIEEQIQKEQEKERLGEQRKDISDLYSQLAYASAQTGQNNLQQLTINEDISTAEKTLQEELIQQSLQSLQDANQKAAEQRERQISVAEQQLEAYLKGADFQEAIEQKMSQLPNDETFQQALNVYATSEMSGTQAKNWAEQFQLKLGLVQNKEQIKQIIAESIQNANSTAVENKNKAIVRAGLNLDDEGVNNLNSEQIAGASSILGQEGMTSTNNRSQAVQSLQNSQQDRVGNINQFLGKDQQVLTADAYYSSQANGFLSTWDDSSKTYKTYDQYLSAKQKIAIQGIGDDIYQDEEKFNAARAILGETDFSNKIKEYIITKFGEYKTARDFFNKMSSGGGTTILRKAVNAIFGADSLVAKWAYEHENELIADTEIKDKLYLNGPHFIGKTFNHNGSLDKWEMFAATINSRTTHGLIADRSQESGLDLEGELGDLAASEDGELYAYLNGKGNAGPGWKKISTDKSGLFGWGGDSSYNALVDKYNELKGYKTGGLADFTGPAWLDGTPSKPEYILNAEQTKRFFSLIDVLEHYKDDGNGASKSGDSYFDININVEKLESDYDVEKVADKIRRMIAEDASYRNVNAINHIR